MVSSCICTSRLITGVLLVILVYISDALKHKSRVSRYCISYFNCLFNITWSLVDFVNNMRRNLAILLAVLAVTISVIALAAQYQVSPNVNAPSTINQPYYAILEYIDYINTTRTVTLAPGQSITIQAPLPPGPGYVLDYVEVSVNPPSPAILISGNNVMYSKNEVGAIVSAYTTSNSLSIANSGNQP